MSDAASRSCPSCRADDVERLVHVRRDGRVCAVRPLCAVRLEGPAVGVLTVLRW